MTFEHCAPGTPIPVDGEPVTYWEIAGRWVPFNLSDHPAVVLSLAQDGDGLPIGVHLIGPRAIPQSLSPLPQGYQRPPGY